jgi:galactose-1-phosphate uridylyltransferase
LKNPTQNGWQRGSSVRVLPNNYKALSSNPSTTKKKKKKRKKKEKEGNTLKVIYMF